MKYPSFYLFARPSFLEGIARIFDFSGTLNEYNQTPTNQIADELALLSDEEAIREDENILNFPQ